MSEVIDAVETPKEAARRISAQARRDGFQPEALHAYTDPNGAPLFWRIRAKHPATGEKWIRPMRHTADGMGYEMGEPPAPPNGKPLYRLRDLTINPDAVVIVCEGEKAADALTRIGCVATTSGGAQSAAAADWSPLAGRRILIWPDFDEPGAQYGRDVAAKLQGIAAEVRIIDVAALGLPPKGDAAEWLQAHPQAKASDVPALSALPVAEGEAPSGVELVCAADLEPQPVSWVWPGWLAAGKLHILAGAPGTGKTTLALAVIAAITSGRPLPDGHIPKRGRAVIWSGEDDPADTLVPRLLAAGAELSRVQFIGEVRSKGARYPFDPAEDVPLLVERLERDRDVSIILIDPIVSAVASDSHKNAEVRRGLAPLVEMAAQVGAALIGVTHYSKGTAGRDPLERVTGSVAFGALARIVWGTVRQPGRDDTNRRMTLARAKSNLGPDGGGFAYEFEQAEPRPGIVTSRIRWGETLEGTARELLAEPQPDGEGGSIDDAVGFLRSLLEDGPMPTKQVQAEATGAGHAWKTIRYAKDRLGVEARRDGGLGKAGRWVWALPAHTKVPIESLRCPPQKDRHLRQGMGILGDPPIAEDELCAPPSHPATSSGSALATDW